MQIFDKRLAKNIRETLILKNQCSTELQGDAYQSSAKHLWIKCNFFDGSNSYYKNFASNEENDF
jgi:hypothetical protein